MCLCSCTDNFLLYGLPVYCILAGGVIVVQYTGHLSEGMRTFCCTTTGYHSQFHCSFITHSFRNFSETCSASNFTCTNECVHAFNLSSYTMFATWITEGGGKRIQQVYIVGDLVFPQKSDFTPAGKESSEMTQKPNWGTTQLRHFSHSILSNYICETAAAVKISLD